MAYPDHRYVAPAGTDAVWIPHESIRYRWLLAVGMLMPFYAALLFRWRNIVSAPVLIDLLASLVLAWLGPVMFTAGPVLSMRAATRATLPDGEWEECIERIGKSTFESGGVALSDHLFLGWVLPVREQAWHALRSFWRFDLPCRTPALIRRAALEGHMHITGPTQSGKTSVGLIGIIVQLIRTHLQRCVDNAGRPITGPDGKAVWREADPSPILVVDLKGDLLLFRTCLIEASRRGQKIRYFTLESGKETSWFSLLAGLTSDERSAIEFTEIILYTLDAFYGFQYGASYYGERGRNLILKSLKNARKLPTNWTELYQLLTENLDPREHRDAFEIVGRIFAISQHAILGAAPDGADVIDMPQVIANNEFVYFWLPALESSMTIVTVAKMALVGFLDAARKFNNSGRPTKRCYAVLDETQVVVGKNLERVFQQASGGRVCLILSNQSLAGLDTRDAPHLSRTIWTNTRVKLSFGLLDAREREGWIELSGETVGQLGARQWSIDPEGGLSVSLSEHDALSSRLNPNDICATNNAPGSALLHVNADTGLCSFGSVPHAIWSDYPMSLAEYRRRSTTPWPDLPVPPATVQPPDARPVVSEPSTIGEHAGYSALDDLFRELATPRRGAGASSC